MKVIYALMVLLISVLFGCDKEEQQLLKQIETTLPGNWHIDRLQLPGYAGGITYKGETFYHDTVLYDVGDITIPSFDVRELDLQNTEPPPVLCQLTMQGELINFKFEHIFLSGKEPFAYLRAVYQMGENINTPANNFLTSSHLLGLNYFIVITGNDEIRIEKAENRTGYVMTLKRN